LEKGWRNKKGKRWLNRDFREEKERKGVEKREIEKKGELREKD
jgi:hypothetical protein